MTPEDEEFNRIEMESRIKQEYVRAMKMKWAVNCSICGKTECKHGSVQFMSISMEDYVEITQKLAFARIKIKELEARIKEMDMSGITDVLRGKQEQVPMDVVLEMRDYIRHLESAVRELNDRLAKLEGEK
jgi:hypothetical protein